jgi:hypothetical protein
MAFLDWLRSYEAEEERSVLAAGRIKRAIDGKFSQMENSWVFRGSEQHFFIFYFLFCFYISSRFLSMTGNYGLGLYRLWAFFILPHLSITPFLSKPISCRSLLGKEHGSLGRLIHFRLNKI